MSCNFFNFIFSNFLFVFLLSVFISLFFNFGNNFINTITEEKTSKYDNERIDEKYLSKKVKDFTKYFYICGPDPMVEAIQKDLLNLGVQKEKIVVEEF